MKIIHHFLLIFIFSISAMHCSDSQNFQGRMNPEARATQLKERLSLNDEQTKKVQQIFLESSEKMTEMREQFGDDRSQMRELMMKNREETNNKIEEILNGDQIELYRQFQQEQNQFGRQRRGQRQEQE